MKPLYPKELDSFSKRFENFIDGEIRSINIVSPTIINITIACQDSARGFDWITIEFEFSNVNDAVLIDDSQLTHVDMSEGIDLNHNGDNFILKVIGSTLQISSQSLKYQEGQF